MYRTAPTSVYAALPLLLLSGAASADLTPVQVWNDWRGYMQDMGYRIEATESRTGADLTISGLRFDMVMPEEDGDLSVSLGDIALLQRDDGAVEVVMPDLLPLEIDVTPKSPDEERVQMTLNLAQTGQSFIASGSPEDITYDYAADAAAMALARLQVGAQNFGPEQASFKLQADKISSRTAVEIDGMRGYEQSGSIARLTYDLAITSPEDDTRVKMTGHVGDLDLSGRGMIPIDLANTQDMAVMLNAGFDIAGKISAASGGSVIEVSDPTNGVSTLNSTSGGGALSIGMAQDGLAYEGEQKDIAVSLALPDLPFPVEFSLAELGFELQVPLSKSEKPQDFAFGLDLDEFVMSDMIWGLFDPTGKLPRDPAALALDISGKAKLLSDLLDPRLAAAGPDAAPGEIEALRLNALTLDAAGAELTGKGDVTFDNSDTTTIPGMPKPVGAVDLRLVGGTALIDRLVAIGLLPSEQAMGARMMLGLFAVPGEGEDTVTSRIEFTEEGQILANGQRIK
ncbi:DUF2125 domain-containing protein [Sulfitobacter aestuarii]|uniref:DUF2125 domain-containing protein n=1 Tax=Sulfitobacter aestuarii TaxID=2161676 RepID=A0ABW5U1C5_9RHOB